MSPAQDLTRWVEEVNETAARLAVGTLLGLPEEVRAFGPRWRCSQCPATFPNPSAMFRHETRCKEA